MREKLNAIWKASGKQPQELADHPAEPPHFAWIWEWFLDLPPPVTWTEIRSWSLIAGIKPARWECEILIRMDIMRRENAR